MQNTLERLLATVTDEDLEQLRDAILREEGRRRTQYRLTVPAPFPPLEGGDDQDSIVERWARLLVWIAKDIPVPLPEGQRGLSIEIVYTDNRPDPEQVGILLQQALVYAGLLLGRTPEWLAATQTRVTPGETDKVRIEMWDKPITPDVWG